MIDLFIPLVLKPREMGVSGEKADEIAPIRLAVIILEIVLAVLFLD